MNTQENICPVSVTVSVIGNKWKILILRNLLEHPWRFNELRKDLNGISQKVLTENLRALEDDGLIVRTAYPEIPPRVEYSVSDLGQSIHPILKAMADWGNYYIKQDIKKHRFK